MNDEIKDARPYRFGTLPRRLGGLLGLALLLAYGLWGCTDRATQRTQPSPAEGDRAQKRLVIFAASSLRDAFEALADSYRRAHPEVQVVLNFAGSQQLRTQVEQGAKPDLFASADRLQLARLAEAGLVSEPQRFAGNELRLAVSKRCPVPVDSLADLPRVQRVVLGTPEVPIGAYSQQLLEKASTLYGPNFPTEVESKVVSRELNVRQLLAKVAMGEADAGLVYRSDLTPPPPGVRAIPIPDSIQVQAACWISARIPGDSGPPRDSDATTRWLELLSSDEGRRLLEGRGFTP